MMIQLLNGDVREQLKTLQSESIDCVVTSPPYWSLRDYGIEPIIWDSKEGCEHEWGALIKKESMGMGVTGLRDWVEGEEKSRKFVSETQFCSLCGAWKGQLGLEPTFDLYIKHLVNIFDEVKRVLKKTGTCFVNLGDTYSGGVNRNDRKKVVPDNHFPKVVPDKSLCMIPFRFAIEMSNRGWILRNELIWYKRNCMPSSVKDRFTVDFEKIFFFVKNKKYWFEQQYEPMQESGKERYLYPRHGNKLNVDRKMIGCPNVDSLTREEVENLQGRNKRCVWDIPTKPFPESHFAVFPTTLVEPMVKSGCPKYVCKKCGKAREKIEEVSYIKHRPSGSKEGREKIGNRVHDGGFGNWKTFGTNLRKIVNEKGYTDCSCNAGFEGGIVLDPFMGSGTVGVVCKRLGMNFIGIDIKKEYVEMARKRIEKVPVRLDNILKFKGEVI